MCRKAEIILGKIQGHSGKVKEADKGFPTDDSISFILNQGPDIINSYKIKINDLLDEINKTLF